MIFMSFPTAAWLMSAIRLASTLGWVPLKLKPAVTVSLPSCLPLSALLQLPVSAPEGCGHPPARQVALVALRERNQDQVGPSVGIPGAHSGSESSLCAESSAPRGLKPWCAVRTTFLLVSG